MEELRWFISILSNNDYHKLVRLIPGFPNDMRSPGDLKKHFEAALSRGFFKRTTSRRRVKSPQIHIRDLYIKIGSDLLKKKSHLEIRNNIDELIVLLANEPRIEPYQQISLIYTLYKDDFDILLEKIIAGSKEYKSILECFSISSSPLDRVKILLRNGKGDIFETLSPNIQDLITRLIPDYSCNECTNDNELFSGLQKENSLGRLALVFNYLLAENRYKNDVYSSLVQYVIDAYYRILLEEEEKQYIEQGRLLKSMNEKIEELTDHYNKTTIEYEQLNNSYHDSLIELKDLKMELSVLRNTSQIQLANNNNLMHEVGELQQQLMIFQELIQYIEGIKGELKVLFVSDDPDFISNLLMIDSASAHDVITWGKTKWGKYSNHIVYINRNSFSNSSEWIALEKTLRKHSIRYAEIVGYDEIGHLTQIINSMLGVDVHVDEITY
ncbi:hypothetical protein [Paenibacillus sp. MSJ-34]|uniref:coiled-coil domain-containing protein n=1 Tax=Paenibacillus sp. MSJ-34 TaxID=2841529 RepID=UPI001C127D70|nr:hypothetical protein [Paenibacillus sp. MSJ-34]MBU5445426.1 hypothetical protein [Paenibacillus sp. MSJ-34]